MKRIAFKMKLKPGKVEDYRARHEAIWPELRAILKECGITEYSIFFDEETHSLFAFQKLKGQLTSQDLGKEEVVQKWWRHLADLMEVDEGKSPVTSDLREVFYLE